MNNEQTITLKGRLKNNIIKKISIKNDEFYSVPMEVQETTQDNKIIDNQFESVLLIF